MPGSLRALRVIGFLAELVTMVDAGSLAPAAPEVRPLDGAVEALRDLLERRVTGKLVLTP